MLSVPCNGADCYFSKIGEWNYFKLQSNKGGGGRVMPCPDTYLIYTVIPRITLDMALSKRDYGAIYAYPLPLHCLGYAWLRTAQMAYAFFYKSK